MIKKWKNSNEMNKESIMKYIKSIHEIEDTEENEDIRDKGNIENRVLSQEANIAFQFN